MQIIPFSKVRALAMGPVELYGEVIAKKLIIEPQTKRECIHYNYMTQGPNMKWASTPFILRDVTGEITVDMTNGFAELPPLYERGPILLFPGAKVWVRGVAKNDADGKPTIVVSPDNPSMVLWGPKSNVAAYYLIGAVILLVMGVIFLVIGLPELMIRYAFF